MAGAYPRSTGAACREGSVVSSDIGWGYSDAGWGGTTDPERNGRRADSDRGSDPEWGMKGDTGWV